LGIINSTTIGNARDERPWDARFNGGFVDTAGFLGLQGLFIAHVTGNFVTLAATLVLRTHGVIAKLLALPEFAAIVALARIAEIALAARGMPRLPR
jgi:uncharacterized membrane protein YoaK (UPF0700 family)